MGGQQAESSRNGLTNDGICMAIREQYKSPYKQEEQINIMITLYGLRIQASKGGVSLQGPVTQSNDRCAREIDSFSFWGGIRGWA